METVVKTKGHVRVKEPYLKGDERKVGRNMEKGTKGRRIE